MSEEPTYDDLMAPVPPNPVIPFGKYKGNYASDIPVEYLDWLIGQDWFVDKFAELCEEVTLHLKNRPDWQSM